MRLLIVAILAYAFMCQSLHAKDSLRMSKTFELENAGIKIRLFMGMTAKPIPTAKALSKRNRQTSTITKVYPISQLWFRDETIGRWGNDICDLLIGEMSVMPADDPNDLVSKNDYEKWTQRNPFKSNNYEKWLEQYCELQLKPDPQLLLKKRDITINEYFPEDASLQASVMVFVAEATTGEKYCLLFKLNDQEKLSKNRKAIITALKSLSISKNETLADSDNSGNKGNSNWSKEYLEDKKRIIDSISNYKSWWYEETENYMIVSNIETKKDIKQIMEDIEKCRTVYKTIFPMKIPLTDISVLKGFRSRDQYLEYVGSEYEDTTGLWMASKNEFIISTPEDGNRKKNRASYSRLVRHEGFHQYIYYATGKCHTARWFNEGNAQFFEGIEFYGRSKFFIKTTSKLKALRELLDQCETLVPENIKLSREEFYFKETKRRNYTIAWGIMYFLHKGSRVIKHKNKYHEIPGKYYASMIKSRDRNMATTTAWEGVDMKRFVRDFKTFWESDRLIKKSEKVSLQKELSSR